MRTLKTMDKRKKNSSTKKVKNLRRENSDEISDSLSYVKIKNTLF
jgi:hypothetical protein